MVDPKKIRLHPASFVRSGANTKLIQQLTEFGQNLSTTGPNELAIANVIALVIGELQQKPAPEAYMGYALYDSDSNLYDQGKVVLSKKARNKHEELIKKIAVPKDGYIETFLVNETSENVWFDQFRIMSTGPLIVQETHYDPWGVELSGLKYQYGGIKINPYLYNGKEANGHLGVNLFDYGARMYDPAIGRWFVVDPMAELAPNLTPYRYGFNNPVKFTDPTGMFEYSDGYSTQDSRNSTGSIGFSGTYAGNSKDTDAGSSASTTVIAESDESGARVVVDDFPFIQREKKQSSGGRLFENEGDAYRFMWNSSFDADGNVSKEVAVFLTKNGVLVLPTEGRLPNGEFVRNGPRESYNNILPLSRNKSTGNLYVTFEGSRVQVLGQVHTHPNTQQFGRYEIVPDLSIQNNILKVPVYIIRSNGFYDLNMNNLGTRQEFFNETKSLFVR